MDERHSRPMWALAQATALVALACALTPAWAQESAGVKELLNRAQTKAQTQAVEDLIKRLKAGESRPPTPSATPSEPARVPAPAKVDPAPDVTTAAPLEATAKPEPIPQGPVVPSEATPPPTPVVTAPAEPLPPPAPIATAPTSAPAASKEEIAQPLPSIDLEVHFDYKSAVIAPQATNLLATLGRALADDRLAGQMFLIAGHTDARGGDAYNIKLSQARAEAVRAFLIQNFAIAPERLRAEGHGFRRLKNPGNPSASENRRVQVTNITPQTARP